MASVGIITHGDRLRRWSAATKLRIVEAEADLGRIEFLTVNGAPYIARDTQIFARQLGLKPRPTPVRSPLSNGMSELSLKP